MTPIRAVFGLPLAIAGLALLLSGCGSSSTPASSASTSSSSIASPTPAPSAPGTLHGRAQAGPSQIAGAHIYVLAANTSGYGTPSLSLIDPTAPDVLTDAVGSYVVSDAQGNFGLTGTYHCTPGQLVYVLARGGSPGGESFNSYLALLSTFGVCPASGNFADQISFVDINQVSTVVGVYALAGFMTDSLHVSASASANALKGLTNAFLTVGNLVDISSGSVNPYTPAGNGSIPVATFNTLANLIVPCSNAAAACAAFFTLTPDLAGNAPADTVQALLNITQNPGANAAALFALAGTQPFQPALAAAPNDWTIGITYFSDTLAGPYFPAFDAGGNLWVPAYANNTLAEFDPFGNPLSGANGFSGGGLAQPFAVAIDPSGNAWVSSYGAISPGAPVVSEFAPNGMPITSNGFACGRSCSFLAMDTQQNLWVSGNPQISVLRNSGVALTAFTANSVSSGIAVDSQGRGWAIGSGRNLSRLTVPATIAQFTEGITSAAGNETNALAIDADDSIWFTSPKNNALGKFSADGSALSPTAGFTGGGLSGPTGVAVDGSGRVWVANRDGNSVSAFTPAGKAVSSATGFQAAGVSNPRGIAVDPSGNVWVTDFTGNAVTEFLGAGSPTATPLTSANHGQKP